MKVIAFIGSPRKSGNTVAIVKRIESELRNKGVQNFEYVFLADIGLQTCLGCQVCYKSGESFCPLQDARQRLQNKIEAADGVILASPTYVMSVSSIMKNFIDRFSFVCHRPRFFRQKFMVVATTGVIGVHTTMKQMKWPIMAWGGRVMADLGVRVSSFQESDRYKEAVERQITRSCKRFYAAMEAGADLTPTIGDLIGFQMKKRRFLKRHTNLLEFDQAYWREKGWLARESRFYHDVRIPTLKNLLAGLIIRVILPFT